MGVRLPDVAESMGDFPVAYAKDIEFADGERLQAKLDNGGLGGDGASYKQLSQAEYDALTDNEKMDGREYRTYDTGHIYKLGVEYGKDADIRRSEVLKTYTSLYNLNIRKGLSLQWENNVDNTQKIIDALEGREEFIDSFSSSTNRIGIVGNYGTTINNFHIIKRSADLAIITATTNDGTILNRTYTNGTLSDWCVNIAVYTSLEQLGLTADATVEDVVNALKSGESFLAPVNTFTNYETIFPNKLPNDQWNKIHIIKGTSLANSHIRCFSQSGTCEYLANVNNTNVVSWNDVSGTYIDISDSTIEKLGNEILKYPVGKYRINSTTTGNKFTDLPSDAETKCGLIEVNGTAVGKSPFTDTWVYRMYKFECLTGISSYVRRLNSGATVGQIELDTGWQKEGQDIYTALSSLGLKAPVSVGEIFNAMPNKTMAVIACEGKEGNTDGAVVHVSDVPVSYGVLTIKKNEKGRFSIEYQNSLQGSPCNVKRWIGTLKGNDGTGLYWKQLSAEPTFVTLNDIGLTADATFQDLIDALPKGCSALLGVKDFTNYQTIFPYEEGNDQFARVHIVKGIEDGSSVYARWFRKDGVKEAIAKFSINTNKFDGWQKVAIKPTTELTDLGLDGSATIQDIMDKMSTGQHCIINTSRFDDKTEVGNIEYGKVEIRRLSSGMWSLWLEDVLHGDVVAHGTCSAGKFAGWQYLASKDYIDSKIADLQAQINALK